MKEYYNVLDSGHRIFESGASGLGIITMGIIMIIIMKKFNAKRSHRIFMYFWTGFGILWTTSTLVESGSEYLTCISAMKNENYKEVEGIIENFVPMPYSGHEYESFTLKSVKFKYSDFNASSGFNNTKSHGGPIDQGKYVRIKYYDGKILQLFVKE